MKKQHIKLSKYLSYVLRHKPEAIGLQLDEAGWASVNDLIQRSAAHGKNLNRELIAEIVPTNDKQRFSLSDDSERIRANQGHSIDIELGLDALEPPQFLYHGTATRFLDSILKQGLRSSGRQHVHLSPDEETALTVGQRHGKPVVLLVNSGSMNTEGRRFFLSANGVWLTATVPPKYLKVLNQG